MDGILVINKEMGYTSFDVIAILRGLIGERHLGHTGTLDPNATGVLPVCIGSTTRLIDYLDSSSKEYIAFGKFGVKTDTQDIWGNVLENIDYKPISKEILLDTIKTFIGEIEQIPPKYSAIRVNGRHLYSYAHSGENIEIPKRKVKVFDIELLSFDENIGEFSIKVKCGRGTYIRTIVSDIGDLLGFGAIVTSLKRTECCGFSLDDAYTLDYLKNLPKEDILDLIRPAEDSIFFMNKVNIDENQKIDFANGKHLKVKQNDMSFEDPVCVLCNDKLCGIGKWDNPNRIKPVKVFVR